MSIDEAIKHCEELIERTERNNPHIDASEYRQLAEWLTELKAYREARAEIKKWYLQADKQELAKDPCVVDAMIDLFIRTIDKCIAEVKADDE